MIKLFLEIVFVVTLVVVGVYAFSLYSDNIKERFSTKDELYTVHVGLATVTATVADTHSERMKGLSGTDSLPEFGGKLFVFDTNDRHGIWMNDMHYPLDIMWFDDQLELIHIEKNIKPDTYPTVFTPEQNARYVLEVNAYFTDDFNIQIGSKLALPGRFVQ